MLKKLERTLRHEIDSDFTISEPVSIGEMQEKINELVDAVNTIQKEREAERFEIQEWIDILEAVRKSVNVHEKQIDELQTRSENVQPDVKIRSENVQPDYMTTTYVTDGHTKEYYGQNGVSIVTDYPLPAGYVITIKEPENKGDDNE